MKGRSPGNRCGFSLALKNNGTVVAWGNNDHEVLGDGTKTSSVVPIKVQNLSGVKTIDAGGGFLWH